MDKHKYNKRIPFPVSYDMRIFPPNYWSCLKEEFFNFNWPVHATIIVAIVTIVCTMALTISPICLVFLLVMLYPLPYWAHRAYEDCKHEDTPALQAIRARSW